ncbi:hypothetical protein [Pelagicoccus albus]|uniref:FlgN protein n=1 Tax=Pelagicoccus albus TaxID=415222 RepID=A0A7X1E815_9BACT|nr:hypothetical protein [Pelagicoccus albus]MBC2605781.1 hypothetical protein [Pelagicoccus albus]
MSAQLSRRMALLAAYEDFTRKETTCLKDGDFEEMLKVQSKKAKVAEALSKLEDLPSEEEKQTFSGRIDSLLEQEKANAEALTAKLSKNRSEFKKLSQNSLSAAKLRNLYGAAIDRSVVKGTLKDKA